MSMNFNLQVECKRIWGKNIVQGCRTRMRCFCLAAGISDNLSVSRAQQMLPQSRTRVI